MRVSNNNQTTFGMNPKFNLDGILDLRLKSLAESARAGILTIGTSSAECKISGTSKALP